MPYVERQNGTIVTVAARRQSGGAQEWLGDDHPDVVAYRAAQAKRSATNPLLDELNAVKERLAALESRTATTTR